METIKAYLPELLSFHEVAAAGGFTQAAEKLNLSKAQLSKHVARLETLLKIQLFHRTTRKVVLTEEGRQLLRFSQGILRLSEEAAETMDELSGKETGVVRITAPSSLGDWFAPPLIKLFQEKLPKIRVEIDLYNVKRDIVQEGYDFAFRAMTETDPDLVARYIGHIRDVVVATPDYVKKNQLKGIDPHELHDVPVLLSSLRQNWNTWKLQRGDKDLVIEVRGQYASSSYQTNRYLSLAGLGVARVPFYIVEKDLKEKKLVQLYKDYSISTHPMYLVYPGKGYRTKKQKAARDLILSWLTANKSIFY